MIVRFDGIVEHASVSIRWMRFLCVEDENRSKREKRTVNLMCLQERDPGMLRATGTKRAAVPLAPKQTQRDGSM